MGETTNTNDIVKQLNQMPMSFAYETPNTGRIRHGRVVAKAKRLGVSDITWGYYGISIKLETKVGDNGQSDDQEDFQKDAEKAGSLYFIVESFNTVLKIAEWVHAQKWFKPYVKARYGIAL
jgi:hypothetical protein